MSPGAWDALDLLLCALFAAGFFYYYAAAVRFEDRAMSRPAALLFLASFAGALVLLVRLLLGDSVDGTERGRLVRAVRWLADGQREAIEVVRRALDGESPAEDALVDLEDARAALGMDDEGDEDGA